MEREIETERRAVGQLGVLDMLRRPLRHGRHSAPLCFSFLFCFVLPPSFLLLGMDGRLSWEGFGRVNLVLVLVLARTEHQEHRDGHARFRLRQASQLQAARTETLLILNAPSLSHP